MTSSCTQKKYTILLPINDQQPLVECAPLYSQMILVEWERHPISDSVRRLHHPVISMKVYTLRWQGLLWYLIVRNSHSLLFFVRIMVCITHSLSCFSTLNIASFRWPAQAFIPKKCAGKISIQESTSIGRLEGIDSSWKWRSTETKVCTRGEKLVTWRIYRIELDTGRILCLISDDIKS